MRKSKKVLDINYKYMLIYFLEKKLYIEGGISYTQLH